MDLILKINAAFISYLTFVLYSLYLYPAWETWNLCLSACLFWVAFIVYDINSDVVFKKERIKKKREAPTSIAAGEVTWQLV